MSGHFVSWVHHHGRSAAIARYLGLEPVWAPAWTRRRPAPVRYLAATVLTAKALLRTTRGPVIVMLPPTPALLVVLLSRFVRRGRVMADLHSGVFLYPRWRRLLRPTLRLLRRHAAIVTNESQAEICRRAGIETYVLDDPLVPAPFPAPEPEDRYVLAALSYEYDEPVSEMLQAARDHPDVRFVFTGSAPEDVIRAAPPNVEFSGFVPREEFVQLLRGAGVVLALTTEQDTMQRAAYEALEQVVPVVTSDTQVLREYFGDAAVFAQPTRTGIGGALEDALARGPELRRRMLDLRNGKLDQQDKTLVRIAGYLEAG
jgi:glycosyltransferase involved in cell wall biosynthesis